MDTKIVQLLLVTHLLLLSPLKCSEEIEGAPVSETVAGNSISKSGQGYRAGRAFCSLRTEPEQLVMFQYLHTSSTFTMIHVYAECSEVRSGKNGDSWAWGSKKIHMLDSVDVPVIYNPEGSPQIQLSLYDWHGDIIPTKFGDYNVENWIRNSSIFCTLPSYEAKFTRKWKTRTDLHCSTLSKLFNEVTPETVPLSSYMAQHMYKVIEEVAKIVSFYRWQSLISEGNLLSSYLPFSISPQHFRLFTVAALVGSSTFKSKQYFAKQLKGFSSDVFKAAVDVWPYHFSYNLVPFYGSADQLVEEVSRKTFDAGVGDIVVTAKNSHLVEYSQPFAELRLVTVVKKIKGIELNNVLWFMRPFTIKMWLSMVAMTVFTGCAVWLIEHRTWNNEYSADSPACNRQVEVVFCFPFSILLFSERRPRNRLTYFVLIPWLMLTLIVSTTFTASLGSIVTSSSQILPSDLDIDSLKRTNAVIACDGNPFTVSYLEKSLGFKPENIVRNVTSIDDFSEVLSSGNVMAAFMLTPDAKFFLAKHCSEGFTQTGHAFNIGSSFAFVFPRDSPLASDMSEAILELKEAGELKKMEEDVYYSSSDCSSSKSDETVSRGIGPWAFSGLFILSGGASASALLITVIRLLINRWEGYIRRMLMVRGLIWMRPAILFSHQNYQTRNVLQLSRIRNTTTQIQQ